MNGKSCEYDSDCREGFRCIKGSGLEGVCIGHCPCGVLRAHLSLCVQRLDIVTNAELLIDLIEDGQKLVADARKQRTTDYESRCASWAKRVEVALQNDAVALVRFWEAERSTNVEPGIHNTIMRDWQMTRGRLVLLIEIARERQDTRSPRS